MYRDAGMAVPKTTETRCRDGSVQAREVVKRLHMQATPSLHLFIYLKFFCRFGYEITIGTSESMRG